MQIAQIIINSLLMIAAFIAIIVSVLGQNKESKRFNQSAAERERRTKIKSLIYIVIAEKPDAFRQVESKVQQKFSEEHKNEKPIDHYDFLHALYEMVEVGIIQFKDGKYYYFDKFKYRC